ncbi:MAG: hypothetical protein GWP59_07770 [Chlamydiales bacterium]|nr:hypothetical protein [Chlamydiales bacterium]NCF71583.1 hypothetical protein [Chlamydiales bacterium]
MSKITAFRYLITASCSAPLHAGPTNTASSFKPLQILKQIQDWLGLHNKNRSKISTAQRSNVEHSEMTTKTKLLSEDFFKKGNLNSPEECFGMQWKHS